MNIEQVIALILAAQANRPDKIFLLNRNGNIYPVENIVHIGEQEGILVIKRNAIGLQVCEADRIVSRERNQQQVIELVGCRD